MNKKNMPEYIAWKAMKARCYSPCNEGIGKYKANNITVCDEWINDFYAFYKDMGDRPSKKHSLDRIDNLKGYGPENCRWVTQDIQCKNRGTFNLIFTYQGESLVLKDWAKKFDIKYGTLWQRIYRSGLSLEEAIKKDAYKRLIQINGISLTVKEWCKKLNLNSGNVYSRINRGMSPIDALTKPFRGIGKHERILGE